MKPQDLNRTFRENTSSSNFAASDEDPRILTQVVIQAAFMLVIILCSIFGNILILLAIRRNRHLQNVTSVFIANLAVADLLLAIIGMPFTMASSITYTWIFGPHWCKINGMANSVFCIASMLSLAAVSIDRYLAIIKPLNYPMMMRTQTAVIMVICVWTQSLLCALMPIFGWCNYTYITNESMCTANWGASIPFTMFIFGSCFFAPLLVMTYSYYHILKAAKRHSRQMVPRIGAISSTNPLRAVMAVPLARSPKKDANSGSPDNNPAPSERKKPKEDSDTKFKRDTKAAKTLLIVMGTFLFCWSPHFIGMTCLLFPSCKWPDWFFATTTWLAMMNSGCNPILYGVLNRRFRQSFKEIVCCGRVSNRVSADFSVYVDRRRKDS